ncbi:MAG: hypothetical protein ACOY5Y_15240 [Pseudomonadota bacterium]|jgi:hypothetical protein
MRSFVNTALIWAGGSVTILALLWIVWTMAALNYSMLTGPSPAPPSAFFLNNLPVAIVGGIPAWIGWLVRRAGLRGRSRLTPS